MRYARVDGGKIVEIIEAPRTIDGVEYALSDLYHPSLVATMHPCADDAAVGDDFEVQASADGDTGNGEPPKP